MTDHHFKRFPSEKVFRQVKITNRKIYPHCTSKGPPSPSSPPRQVESHLSVFSRRVQKTSFSLPSLQTLSLPEQMFLQHFLSKLTVGQNHKIHHKKEEIEEIDQISPRGSDQPLRATSLAVLSRKKIFQTTI